MIIKSIFIKPCLKLCWIVLLCAINATAKANAPIINDTSRINIMVANTVRDFDLYTKTLFLRAKIKSIFSKGKFVVVSARSSEDMFRKISSLLQKKTMLGTLWFDSHGYYKNGYSSFSIGHEEFSFRTIKDLENSTFLRKLSAYCDSETSVLIGSCFGGATYQRKLFNDSVYTRMNGDSLMMMLSVLLNGSTVYGSESWVMMKPGTFNKGYAFAGFPPGKKFRDKTFEPAWQKVGVWNQYSAKTKTFKTVPTVSLNEQAEIKVMKKHYHQKGNKTRGFQEE
jgi:hypothetical protein